MRIWGFLLNGYAPLPWRVKDGLFPRCNPSTPVLYTLIKTHKDDVDLQSTDPNSYKVRPIISSCGGPADKVSWLLTKFLSPLLDVIPSHLRNTEELLSRLNVVNSNMLPENVAFASFDVVSLYTNIDREAT